MKRTLLAAAVLLSALVPTLRAATSSAYNVSQPFVLIDGVLCNSAEGWSGGGVGAEVVVAKVTTGIAKKSIGGLAYDPVTVESSLPLSPELQGLLGSLCNGGYASTNLVLGQLNHNGQPAGTTIQCANAQLLEVKFSETDAASRSSLKVTFIFQPEYLRYVAAPAIVASTGTRAKLASAAVLALPGVAGDRVSRIGEIRIFRTLRPDSIGELRDYERTTTPVQFANIKISIASNDTTWAAWRDDFLVKGNAADANEKAGTVTFVDATQLPVFTLQLLNAGLTHFSTNTVNGSSAALEAVLYVEQIKPAAAAALTKGGAVATGSKSSPKADATTPADAKNKPTPEAEPVTAPTPAADTVATDAGALKKPDGKVISKREATKFPTVKNPEDKGARDPEGSPRPDGTVRKSYMMSKGKDYSQENVSYATARPIDELEAFYDKALVGDGWTEYSRLENDQALNHAHQLIIKYSRAKDAYTVTFTDTKPGEVTIDIRIDRVL